MNLSDPSANEALDNLRMERSEINQFDSKVEFFCWADEVKAALANDDRARRQFANYVATAESMYALKADPLSAINNAIGLVNQVYLERRQASMKEEVRDPVEIRDQSGDNDEANKHTNAIVQGAWAWLKKFSNTTLSKVVAGLLLACLYFLIQKHFGISLPH